MQQEYITKLRNLGYTGEIDLESLIEACGDSFVHLDKVYDTPIFWRAVGDDPNNKLKITSETGNTPKEAVANLWIAINKKQ